MKILAVSVVYNEIDILPYLLAYYESQDIEVFIFDNYSNDGTWEYLQDHNVHSQRLNSDGKFSLVQFIEKMCEVWHSRQPDWCIYSDADEFPLTLQFRTLNEFIADRAFQGFNVIKQLRVNFRPTGTEDYSLGDPFKIYRYYFIKWPTYQFNVYCERIFKYSPQMDVKTMAGHEVLVPGKKAIQETIDNPIFHYTFRQNARQKIHRYFYRKMIDEETSRRGWNVHYALFIKENKWIFDPVELNDIEDPENELNQALARKTALDSGLI